MWIDTRTGRCRQMPAMCAASAPHVSSPGAAGGGGAWVASRYPFARRDRGPAEVVPRLQRGDRLLVETEAHGPDELLDHEVPAEPGDERRLVDAEAEVRRVQPRRSAERGQQLVRAWLAERPVGDRGARGRSWSGRGARRGGCAGSARPARRTRRGCRARRSPPTPRSGAVRRGAWCPEPRRTASGWSIAGRAARRATAAPGRARGSPPPGVPRRTGR